MEKLHALLAELTCGDDERAEVAAGQLASYGDAAVGGIKPLLASQDGDTRWWAVRALAELDSDQATRLITPLLSDPEPAVRQCAARALQQRQDPKAVSSLINALADHDSLVARLAANALVTIGEPSVAGLIDRLQNGPSRVQLEAVRALALIGAESSIPALSQALEGDSSLMEYWASEGLDRMGIGMLFFKP